MPLVPKFRLLQCGVYQLRLFFTALQFFTRLPIPAWVGFDPAWLQYAARYLPMIGWLVALVTAFVVIVAQLLWAPIVAVLLSTIAGILLTGALHEDGFADVCDGFGGVAQTPRILEIMRDSSIGAYGAMGIVLLLATKITALSLLPPLQIAPALLLAHPVSRWMSISLIWRMQYVGEQGKAKPVAQQMSVAGWLFAAVTALVPLLLCGGMRWLPWISVIVAILLAVLVTLYLARKFAHRIGGYTGDCLGAVQQVSEVACYLGLLAVAGY